MGRKKGPTFSTRSKARRASSTSYRTHGVPPEKIDIVINTHLHFDHCGWNTRVVNGQIVPTFPHARYIVQRGELEHARDPSDRDRASYFPENFTPMKTSGQWSLLDGYAEMRSRRRVASRSGPQSRHDVRAPDWRRQNGFLLCRPDPNGGARAFPWIMGYDLYPLTTLENKKKWVPQAAREGWLVIFGHEPITPAGYLTEQQGKYVLEPVMIDV